MHLVNFLMLVIVQRDIGCNSDAKNGLLHAMIVVQLTIICIFVCMLTNNVRHNGTTFPTQIFALEYLLHDIVFFAQNDIFISNKF